MRTQDPMLKTLHSTIRSLRQAQRRTLHKTHRALQTFRTIDEAEAALDDMACEGLIQSDARHRLLREQSGFVLELAQSFHNQ